MSITVLAGPPCSWKTTYLKKIRDHQVCSSDDEIELLEEKKYSQNQLNSIWVSNALNKFFTLIKYWEKDVVYDSTNLTPGRRTHLFYKIDETVNIEAVSFLSDFNTIYKNWETRWKDMKEEILLYLFMIFEEVWPYEWFKSVKLIENIEENNFKYLKLFLEWKDVDKEKLLDENKDLKVLCNIWQKAWRNYFEEYEKRVNHLLVTPTHEEKLGLLYTDIKYFYIDFINKMDLTYSVSYDYFLERFRLNILRLKVNWLWYDVEKVYISFYESLRVF